MSNILQAKSLYCLSFFTDSNIGPSTTAPRSPHPDHVLPPNTTVSGSAVAAHVDHQHARKPTTVDDSDDSFYYSDSPQSLHEHHLDEPSEGKNESQADSRNSSMCLDNSESETHTVKHIENHTERHPGEQGSVEQSDEVKDIFVDNTKQEDSLNHVAVVRHIETISPVGFGHEVADAARVDKTLHSQMDSSSAGESIPKDEKMDVNATQTSKTERLQSEHTKFKIEHLCSSADRARQERERSRAELDRQDSEKSDSDGDVQGRNLDKEREKYFFKEHRSPPNVTVIHPSASHPMFSYFCPPGGLCPSSTASLPFPINPSIFSHIPSSLLQGSSPDMSHLAAPHLHGPGVGPGGALLGAQGLFSNSHLLPQSYPSMSHSLGMPVSSLSHLHGSHQMNFLFASRSGQRYNPYSLPITKTTAATPNTSLAGMHLGLTDSNRLITSSLHGGHNTPPHHRKSPLFGVTSASGNPNNELKSMERMLNGLDGKLDGRELE